MVKSALVLFGVAIAYGMAGKIAVDGDLRIFSIEGRVCSGERRQFMPTMSALRRARVFFASRRRFFLRQGSSVFSIQTVTITGRPVFFARSNSEQSFPKPGNVFSPDDANQRLSSHGSGVVRPEDYLARGSAAAVLPLLVHTM